MSNFTNASPHTFHIPVMGTGFTIDTPLHVARYGISSVISLVDDFLIEQMRKYHCERAGEPYEEIPGTDIDARAHRITAYLNLLDGLILKQVEALKASPFEDGSEITKYFELMPDCPLKSLYRAMLETQDSAEKERIAAELREGVVAGSIDVNIMTKLDCERFANGEKLPSEYSDAKAALRGFALSDVRGAIVCSAGMNRDLYKYFGAFDDFFPDEQGELKKKIILKVSDYRSAEIQGRLLAKLGLWVSEYRIESGLNCGGHAFATKGLLLGPIMEEFKEKRERLAEELNSFYSAAITSLGRKPAEEPFDIRITVQGGIGTASEDKLLLGYYAADGTGWGTPFLLVPDVVSVDKEHIDKLAAAGEDDVFLSDSSPLGVPFWNLRNSASEEARNKRIAEGKPGSVCIKGYLKFNTDITDNPVCTASITYVHRMLALLEKEIMSPEEAKKKKESVLAKSCICNDLAGGALGKYDIDPDATTAICPGPNIAYFSKIATLQEMIDHIYGRISLLVNTERPHVFANELKIYIDYFKKEVMENSLDPLNRSQKYLTEFKENLLSGIDHYIGIAEQCIKERKERFIADMNALKMELESIPFAVSCAPSES